MSRHAMAHDKPFLPSAMAWRAMSDARGLGERWAMLGRTLALWRRRARSRAELDRIPKHRLNDLPADMSAIQSERAKWFWQE